MNKKMPLNENILSNYKNLMNDYFEEHYQWN